MVKVKATILPGVAKIDKHTDDKGERGDVHSYEFRKKLKKSTFMMTINSNKSNYSEAFLEKFKTFNNFLFAGNRILKYMRCKHCETGKCKEAGQESRVAKCIQSINLVVKFEVSPQSAGRGAGKLHSHVAIECIHTGSVQVNMPLVKKLGYRYFGYRPYFQIRGAGDIAFGRRQYLLSQGREAEADAEADALEESE